MSVALETPGMTVVVLVKGGHADPKARRINRALLRERGEGSYVTIARLRDRC